MKEETYKELEVGDRVRLKKGLQIGEQYNHLKFAKRLKFEEALTIIRISPIGTPLLSNDFYYTKEMLSDEVDKSFRVGNKVKLKKGLRDGKKYGFFILYPKKRFRGTKKIVMVTPIGAYLLDNTFIYPAEMLEGVSEGGEE